jgi:hypothetical protein
LTFLGKKVLELALGMRLADGAAALAALVGEPPGDAGATEGVTAVSHATQRAVALLAQGLFRTCFIIFLTQAHGPVQSLHLCRILSLVTCFWSALGKAHREVVNLVVLF